ncbi:MAG TPA: carboxypeptidase-like regulatory domain-containing protein, partial [Vicinamibacterales bacterium]
MPSDRSSSLLALLFVGLTALPAPAFAQAAIAGSVRDGSGLPVAGVLVETASPALIERVRTTATDGTGRFRIDDLRPGLYSLTFERAGFKTHHLEAVALSGSFTATADVVLQVGDLSESVTVSGALPIVDLQSATREATITGNMIRAIPAARTYNALVALVPGVLTNANDTVITAAATTFPIHGGRTNEGRLLLDGFVIGSPSTGSSATSYAFDVGYAEEIAFTTSGGLGESETAGLVMNIVPKSGGNDRHGSFFGSSTATWLQSDNLTEALRDQGLTGTMPLTKLYDVSGSFGGPVRRNRVWYFVSAHRGSATREVDNVYYNLNAGNGAQWLYAPDATRREYSDRVFENASGRVTWQMTPRNQLTGYLDLQSLCRTCTGATPGLSEPARVSPEAVGVLSRPLTVWQVRWYSPPSDRWLLDAGVSAISFGVGNFERSPNPTRGLVRVAEQCASGCA